MKQEIFIKSESVFLSVFDYTTPEQAAELMLAYSKKLKKGEIGRFVAAYGYEIPELEFHTYRLETDKEVAAREAAEAEFEADRLRRKLEREAKKHAKIMATIAQDQAAELALLAQLKAKYEGVKE